MSDKEYGEVLDDAYDKADVLGKANPDKAWVYVDDAVWWPNTHYKGDPVCHPELDPFKTDGQQWNPTFGMSLREKFEARKNDQT